MAFYARRKAFPQNDDWRKWDQKQLTTEGGKSQGSKSYCYAALRVCVVVNYQSSPDKREKISVPLIELFFCLSTPVRFMWQQSQRCCFSFASADFVFCRGGKVTLELRKKKKRWLKLCQSSSFPTFRTEHFQALLLRPWYPLWSRLTSVK